MAAGVIQHPLDDRIFIAKRLDGTPYEGYWEYPGGKIEPGETALQALRRELQEECGIEIQSARPLIRVSHDYPDRSVELNVFLVTDYSGAPHGREGQETAWMKRGELRDIHFLDGNRPITNAVLLDDRYAITNTRVYSHDTMLNRIAQTRGPRLIQVRDKHLTDAAYLDWARAVVAAAESSGKQVLINRGLENLSGWLQQTGAHGAHLDSAGLMAVHQRPVADDVWLSASCHNAQEILQAGNIGVDFAVVSPVQKTGTHPDAVPIGWDAFGAMCDLASYPVFALGGLGEADRRQAWEHGGQGVAMISGAWRN